MTQTCCRNIMTALAIGAIGLTTAASADVIVSASSPTNMNIEIPDDGYDGSLASMASHSLEFGIVALPQIVDITVTIAIDHTFIGDLTIKLMSPNGTVVTLVNRPGFPGGGDNGQGVGGDSSNLSAVFPILFADNAPSGVIAELMGAGISGSQIVGDPGNGSPDNYIPFPDGAAGGTLSDFFGESVIGTWTLFVGDSAIGAVGHLQSWSMSAQVIIPTPGVAVVLMMGLLTGRSRRRSR